MRTVFRFCLSSSRLPVCALSSLGLSTRTEPTLLLGPLLPSHLHALFLLSALYFFGVRLLFALLFLVALRALPWCTLPLCAHYSAVCPPRCAFVSLASHALSFALVALKVFSPFWVVC